VSGEQMSLGSKCPWGASVARANVRGASVAGATVWGAPFMDSFLTWVPAKIINL